ncbi:hypothetical protein B0H63DRAFT_519020 [Podospora didyma]|uniref:Uncharacterized protein n=1 Tax=Podospora didyma TaxID=330526 RepID=A0AAE0NXY2_9PEZI|nr:hypothetical protein B0H63DRAFT_519020 [Podospora didyma]
MSSATELSSTGPLGALTTPFAGEFFCSNYFQVTSYDGEPSEAATSLHRGDIYDQLYPPYPTNPCYPSGFPDKVFTTYFDSYWFYSPGVCPSGWTSADSSRSDRSYKGLTTKAGEYAVLCCPSINCISELGRGPEPTPTSVRIVVWPGWAPFWDSTTTLSRAMDYTTAGPLPYTADNTTSWVRIVATAVQVRYHASDSFIANGTLVSQVATSVSATTATAAGPTNSQSTLPSDSSGGISPGAKAGIGLSVTLAVLAIIAFVLFRWRQARRQRQEDLPAQVDGEANMASAQMPEKGAIQADTMANSHYPGLGGLESTPVVMPGAHELDIIPTPPHYELPNHPAGGASGTHTPKGPSSSSQPFIPSPLSTPMTTLGTYQEHNPSNPSSGIHSPRIGTGDMSPRFVNSPPLGNLSGSRSIASASEPESASINNLLSEYKRVKTQKERLEELGELERREAELEQAIRLQLAGGSSDQASEGRARN